MNVTAHRQDEEDLYGVIKELLPQIEKELREELETKYSKIFAEKESSMRKQFEDAYAKKLQRALQEQEQRIQAEYSRMTDQRILTQSKKKEEGIGKQVNDIRQRVSQLEKEVQVLRQQKINWVKLEKGYQKALRELNINQENSNHSNISETRLRSNTAKDFAKPTSKRELSNLQIDTLPSQSKLKPQLIIQTQNSKQFTERLPLFKTSSALLYKSGQTEESHSQLQGILSPPSVDPDLIESVLEYNANPKPPQKQMYWNEEKKQELLKMIRLRMN